MGYGDDREFSELSKNGYRRRDSKEYDDCIMHEAQKQVPKPPYSLLGIGVPKYNCQDYADALRKKYAELEKDEKIKTKCGRCKK